VTQAGIVVLGTCPPTAVTPQPGIAQTAPAGQQACGRAGATGAGAAPPGPQITGAASATAGPATAKPDSKALNANA
jgi:hypothetical protein